MKNSTVVSIEALEPRALLAATTVSVVASIPTASESHRTTTGRGEFVFKRPTGDTTLPLSIKFAVNGDSTATNGVDFETLSGKIVIPSGKRGVAVNLFPINDSIHESTETVIVTVKDQSGYSVAHRSAVVSIRDNDPATSSSTQGWWDTSRHFRTALTFNSGSFVRTNEPVDQSINLTTSLSAAGGSGSIIDDSIRVIETTADGSTVVDSDVPFQFDKSSNYNAATNASGTLVYIAKGSTSANTTRYYHVYFDTTGTFTPYSFTSQVATDSNASDEGMNAFKITTNSATYYLQKANGGFSSILDTAGNDWLSFNPTPGSQSGGEFRGTPNAVFPGGGFHAGFSDGSSVLINSGPLKTTIDSTISVDKQISGSPFTYKMRYEIYGNFVRATMLQAGSSYWFLYEGTPGGSVDGNDTVVRSSGTVTNVGDTWDENSGIGSASGTGSGQEWAYFRDSQVGKYIYFAHNTADSIKDSYYEATSSSGNMTVFGFGRDNSQTDPNRELLTAQNNSFTFGLADGGGDFAASAAAINGTYQATTAGTGATARLT